MAGRQTSASGPGLPALTVRGWFLATSSATAVVVAYVTGWRALLYVGLVLALVVVLSVAVVGARSGRVQVRRRAAPDPVGLGEVAHVVVSLRNDSVLPLAASEWRDGGSPELGVRAAQPLPPLAPRGRPGSDLTLRYAVESTRRGEFELGPLLVTGTDPFGLCRREQTLGGPDRVIVLPRLVPLGGMVAAPVAQSEVAARAVMTGRSQDDVIAREYRPGDALRHVHWRASAHRGELMVRQEQRHDDAHSIVLLDNRREHWRSTTAFEWAVSFAASVVVHLAARGSGVRLVLTVPGSGDDASEPIPRETLLRLATVNRHTPRAGTPDHLSILERAQEDFAAPLFVVAGDMDESEWNALLSRRVPGGHSAAVLVDSAGVPDRLWAAGWRCVDVADPDTDMGGVWRTISAGAPRG